MDVELGIPATRLFGKEKECLKNVLRWVYISVIRGGVVDVSRDRKNQLFSARISSRSECHALFETTHTYDGMHVVLT